jgi:adenosylcobyric acid synthase
MFQGTGSDVGKSLLVAGLCRAFSLRGLKVAPFKPQNMSNNAAVTADSGEIGRAQALQARACGIAPSLHMNPVLLKPQTDVGAQVVVQGKVVGNAGARDYHALKPSLLPKVLDSFHRMGEGRDLLLIEGAGSAAEVNLRSADIANMGFAEAADVPVVLVADIDRGGVIASLVGTHALLPEAERQRIKGFIVNKFRGDPALFLPAMAMIEARTGWKALGLVPWFPEAARLPAEDAASLRGQKGEGRIHIVVPQLSRIANFDDFDPLAAEPDVSLEFIPPGRPLPAGADLVILPGSKSTIADLAFFRAQGWDIDLMAHVRRGGRVLGICAGYQMLGSSVSDPDGIEGEAITVPGLGLLAVETVMEGAKTLREIKGSGLGQPVKGYEMHMGRTEGPDRIRPLLTLDGEPDGAISKNGSVMGCYLHGLFASDSFRKELLASLCPGRQQDLRYESLVENTLNSLAIHLEQNLNLDDVLALSTGFAQQ